MNLLLPIESILVVEDSNEDFFVLQRAMRAHFASTGLHWLNSAARTLDYIQTVESRQIPPPTAIVLDLSLPDGDGRHLLQRIRTQPRWSAVPVLIFSGSLDAADIEWCRIHGADSYHVKGTGLAGLPSLIEKLRSIRN